jgi:hypothetical protein
MEILAERDTRLPAKRPRELALSAAWHGGLTRSLVDTEGRAIDVVFPGHWSHGLGPDFSDAMLEIPGQGLVTGSIELHHDASDWTAHGHDRDDRYNDVVLHVVSRLDMSPTRRADGSIVPAAVLTVPDEMLFRIDARLPGIWSELGGDVCAAELSASEPASVVGELHRLGNARLHDRITRIEGELAVESARNVLTTLLFDALGYTENREPMTLLANRLNQIDWSRRLGLVPVSDRAAYCQAVVFGIGGYLPLSPGDANLARIDPRDVTGIERRWFDLAVQLGVDSISATEWVRARTRPANHPIARLAIASRLLVALHNDPIGDVIRAVRGSVDLVSWVKACSVGDGAAVLGESRARAIAANVLLPFAIAVARGAGDDHLEDIASTAWQNLGASEWSRPAKRALQQVAGPTGLRNLGERGHQGLLKLDRDFCTPRRCFECPIAANVVRHQISAKR